MSPSRILIVEDEAIVSESLHDQLEKLGYRIVGQLASGEEAVAQVAQLQPDLILMDIMLEGEMDGVQASEMIRKQHDIPIVYLTAYSDENTLERAKITEPFGYIIKPFKERELHTTIEIARHKHRLEKQIKDSERWLSSLLRSIGDAVIATDNAGLMTFSSPVVTELLGWTFDDLKGHSLVEMLSGVADDSQSLLQSLLQKAIEGESTHCLIDQDLELLTRSQESCPVDLSVSPILNEKEQVTGLVWAIRDIRKRKQAEEQLTEAQALLANTLTPRETQILQLMVDGSTTKEIAYDLEISPRTVEAHRQNMMEKLNAHDIASLIKIAITHKLAKLT